MRAAGSALLWLSQADVSRSLQLLLRSEKLVEVNSIFSRTPPPRPVAPCPARVHARGPHRLDCRASIGPRVNSSRAPSHEALLTPN